MKHQQLRIRPFSEESPWFFHGHIWKVLSPYEAVRVKWMWKETFGVPKFTWFVIFSEDCLSGLFVDYTFHLQRSLEHGLRSSAEVEWEGANSTAWFQHEDLMMSHRTCLNHGYSALDLWCLECYHLKHPFERSALFQKTFFPKAEARGSEWFVRSGLKYQVFFSVSHFV